MNVAVLVSGSGTNLQAIIDSIKEKTIENCDIKVVISNKETAYALERARKEKIETVFLNSKDYSNREEYDKEIVRILNSKDIDFVILAGYLRWISPYFIECFRNKILNIHPSLLPSFKGLHAIEQAFDYGVKETGVTVHFVDETEDGGSIILQESICVEQNDTLESLEEKIHKIEHRLYPRAINLLVNNQLIINGRNVRIK